MVEAAKLAFGPLPTSIPGELAEAPRPAAPDAALRQIRGHDAGTPPALTGEPARGPAAEVEALIEAERARRAGQ